MSTDTDIGLRIRERRNELALTVRELARRTSLSASFISQVERGKTKVSLDSLRNIAEQLEVSIQYFFTQPEPVLSFLQNDLTCDDDTDIRAEYSPVVRAGCRPKLYFPDSGVSYEMLMTDLNRKMEAIYGKLSPGTGNVARRLRKPTEELIFVLSGSLLIGLQDKEYILNPGDSIYFEGDDLKQLACASETENVIWISVITPPVF